MEFSKTDREGDEEVLQSQGGEEFRTYSKKGRLIRLVTPCVELPSKTHYMKKERKKVG